MINLKKKKRSGDMEKRLETVKRLNKVLYQKIKLQNVTDEEKEEKKKHQKYNSKWTKTETCN